VCVDPGEREAILGTGGPGPQKRKGAAVGSRQWGRRDVAAWPPRRDAGDGLATTSRNGYAQSECYCALYSNCIV
jgi:hypothetical protein